MAREHFSHPSKLLPHEPLATVSARDARLTQQHLSPVLAALETCLLELRQHIDAELLPRQPMKLGKPYPLGQCQEISQALRTRIAQGEPSHFSATARMGWNSLRGFVQAGGTFRAVWGDLRGLYFQNAFQLGSLYVDIANDTVVASKPKVEILPWEQAGLSAIADFAHFRKRAQSYWGQTVYPNHAIPQLAPYCPFILLRPDGLLQMHEATDYMVGLAARDHFGSSEAVLKEAPLPDAVFERIARSLRHLGMPLPANAAQGRGQALQHCRTYRAKSHYSTPPSLSEVLQTAALLNLALVRYVPPYAPEINPAMQTPSICIN